MEGKRNKEKDRRIMMYNDTTDTPELINDNIGGFVDNKFRKMRKLCYDKTSIKEQMLA